jgi:RNA polymerase sigma-B factor
VRAEELFRRWQDHKDTRARDALVERYMPLTIRLSRRYRGANEPFDDLKQAASIGLLKAIDRFDATRGIGFEAYAVPTILGELKRYFRDCCWAVHMPRGIQDLAVKVDQAQRKLSETSERPPTFQDLAQYLEISVEDVLDAMEASTAHHAVSLDSEHQTLNGDVTTLGDSLGKIDPGFDLVDCGESIRTAAAHLPERERQVLALRFIEDLPQTEIAHRIGVSQMQVSRILRKAVASLSSMVDGESEA